MHIRLPYFVKRNIPGVSCEVFEHLLGFCPGLLMMQMERVLLSTAAHYRHQTQTGVTAGIPLTSVFWRLQLASVSQILRKEGNALFNDALNTFYLQLYGVKHMVKDHSDSDKGNLLPPLHGLLFSINSKGSFICTIPQTGLHIPWPLLHQSWSTGWNEK